MNDQPQPVHPEDDQRSGSAGIGPAEEGVTARSGYDTPAGQYGRVRQPFRNAGGSESTREMRDTARRRRDAEDKLQQHLLEAANHVPNGSHGEHGRPHSHHVPQDYTPKAHDANG